MKIKAWNVSRKKWVSRHMLLNIPGLLLSLPYEAVTHSFHSNTQTMQSSSWYISLHLNVVGGCFCCSVTQLGPTLCSMDCSMPGFPVLHCFLEFAQICVHCIGDAIQLSSEVKWALGSTAVNKVSGWDGILVELFKALKRWCYQSAVPRSTYKWLCVLF